MGWKTYSRTSCVSTESQMKRTTADTPLHGVSVMMRKEGAKGTISDPNAHLGGTKPKPATCYKTTIKLDATSQ